MKKTTLEIPDGILRRAKAVAAERGIPLRALISEALADKLRSEESGNQNQGSRVHRISNLQSALGQGFWAASELG